MRKLAATILICLPGWLCPVAVADDDTHVKAESKAESVLPTQPSEHRAELLEDEARTNRISDLGKISALEKYQLNLESARQLRLGNELKRAESAFIQLLESRAPEEIKRVALLDLAMVMHDQRELTKAQHLYSQYVRKYEKDLAVPEVLLRQAYLYRQMGISGLALAKFYGVISSCLNLQVKETEYYQKLVLRAQAEIAETYFLDGKFTEAVDYYERLLRLNNPFLGTDEVLYKLARCYSALDNYSEAVAHARTFLERNAEHSEAAEARFLAATALKKLGRNDEALHEISTLLAAQRDQSKSDPKQWLYWQQRAGNEIANQLYREGDFINALQVYQLMAAVNRAPEWQIPVWYQIGLVFENLKQHQKAAEMYDQVIARGKEAVAAMPNANIKQVAEMAAWRKQHIQWEANAQLATQQLQKSAPEPSPL